MCIMNNITPEELRDDRFLYSLLQNSYIVVSYALKAMVHSYVTFRRIQNFLRRSRNIFMSPARVYVYAKCMYVCVYIYFSCNTRRRRQCTTSIRANFEFEPLPTVVLPE